jgi:CRP/FNR family cyclic AMP-dependent transcriptional regulator
MKKILLIEDNDEIRENTAEILELSNYKVLTAENGKRGVELAMGNKPDLIVCDIMMPVLDGYGVLMTLQKNSETQNIPFIFLTAKAERNDFRKGMELGADDYITKPFEGSELLNAIEGRLRKVDLLKQELQGGIQGVDQLLYASGIRETLQSMTEGRNIIKYKKKQQAYTEGNRPTRLFYLQKGKIKTFKTNEYGKELVIGLYNEGDFFGYTALLEGTAYHETAEALEETELAVIPREDFEQLVYSNREIAQKFIKLLVKNVSEKENQLLGIAYNSLRKKVAEALVTLKNKFKGSNENFSIDISRENLASVAGTATESLIRTLTDFRSEKIIDIVNGNIQIINEKKLENLMN